MLVRATVTRSEKGVQNENMGIGVVLDRQTTGDTGLYDIAVDWRE